MATLPALVPVDEYIRDYVYGGAKPVCEYSDGILITKPMGTFAHARMQARLTALLQGRGFEVLIELHARLRPAEFRVPDIVLMAASAITGDYPGPDNPPHLCIEILSPGQGIGETLGKCERYQNWGVPFCWVIDPEKRIVWVYHKNGEPVKLSHRNAQITAGPIGITLGEVFG